MFLKKLSLFIKFFIETVLVSLQELNDYVEQLLEELDDLHVQFDALSKEHKVGRSQNRVAITVKSRL